MRHIAKRRQHVDCLFDEQKSPPVTSAEAAQRWDRFKGKSLLSSVLLDEQYGLCAYTELRPDEARIGTHIEHVKPKSRYPDLTFCYRNLVISALESNDLQRPNLRGDQFGGHAKGSKYDREKFISPLRGRSKRGYFLYQSDGKVVPSPYKTRRYQKKAEYTHAKPPDTTPKRQTKS